MLTATTVMKHEFNLGTNDVQNVKAHNILKEVQ